MWDRQLNLHVFDGRQHSNSRCLPNFAISNFNVSQKIKKKRKIFTPGRQESNNLNNSMLNGKTIATENQKYENRKIRLIFIVKCVR